MTLDINLQINGKNITDIATLKENFSLDYILEAYKNKKLEKWLIAGGFMDYLEKIVEIDINQCDLYLAMQLIMVFDIRFSNIEEKKIIAAYTKCNKNASFDETNIINHVPKKIQYIIKNPTDNLITESSFLNLKKNIINNILSTEIDFEIFIENKINEMLDRSLKTPDICVKKILEICESYNYNKLSLIEKYNIHMTLIRNLLKNNTSKKILLANKTYIDTILRVCDLYKNTVLSAKNSFNIPIDILTILLENKETQSILMNDVNEKEYKSWTQDIGEQLFIDWMEITNKKILVLSITISRKYEEIFLTQFNEDKIFCLQNKKMETNKYKKQTDKTYYTFDDIKNCVMNGLKIKRSNKGFSPIVNIVYIEIE